MHAVRNEVCCFVTLFVTILALNTLLLSRSVVRALRRQKMTTSASLQIPKIDDRIYFQFTLSNGIPVTLVHDRTSEKCSCSLSVKTGAMYDPLPGIAHITEHAVFLGSAKYPVENAYKNFLNKNGGSSNAGTSMEYTTYKFNVNSDAFDPALDLFSQFFKSPLFATEAISREIMAVDSEDSKNHIIDSRRMLQVLKHQIDPSSQYSKFSTGNLRTLAFGDVAKYGENLSNVVRSFHGEHYLPQRMAVAMVGPQPIEQLKQLAEAHFSNIIEPTPVVVAPASVDPLLASTNVASVSEGASASLFAHGGGKLIKLRPIKDLRDLTIVWQLPGTASLYRKNPCTLLGFLLGNKGEGSWFAALQDMKWATTTSAGVRTTFGDFTLFEATVSLTEEGMQHWEHVMALLYQNIDAIHAASDAELQRAWTEMRTINTLDFQYREKKTAYELAPELATNMLEYQPEHILSAGWLLDEEVDVPRVRAFAEQLRLDNSLVFLRCKTFAESPVSLGSDDEHYLHKEAFVQYEAQLQAASSSPLPSVVEGDDLPGMGADTAAEDVTVTVPRTVTSSADTDSALRDLEASKLSGRYFHDLRAFLDAQFIATRSPLGNYRTEPYYGVPYHVEELSCDRQRLGDTLRGTSPVRIALPPPNPFICTELIEELNASAADQQSTSPDAPRPLRSAPPRSLVSLLDRDTDRCEVSHEDLREVWFSKDEVFRQPRSIFFNLFESQSCVDGHPVLSLMSSVFSQVTARNYYQPATAGLGYSLSIGTRGMGLNFYGYTPKLANFAATVSRDVGDLSFWSSVHPSVIENSKDRLLRTFRSWVKERPDAQCESLLRYLLQEGTWLPQDRLKACEAIDVAYFHHRVANTLQFDRAVSYTHGDCDLETAIRSHRQVRTNVNAANVKHDLGDHLMRGKSQTLGAVRAEGESLRVDGERSRLLPRGTHKVIALPAFNNEDPNCALVTFMQADFTSPRTSAMMLFLRRLLGEPAFTELRTKKQLGYIVALSPSGYGRGWKAIRGISVRILSRHHSPLAMESALNDFFIGQRETLTRDLTDEAVAQRCAAIIRSLEDPPTTYSEEASEHWDSIVHGMPFDWTPRVIAELRTLDKGAVMAAAEQWLFDPASRRSVSMMIFSPEHETLRQQLIAEGDVTGVPPFGVEGKVSRHFSIDDVTGLRDTLELAQNPTIL